MSTLIVLTSCSDKIKIGPVPQLVFCVPEFFKVYISLINGFIHIVNLKNPETNNLGLFKYLSWHLPLPPPHRAVELDF